MPRLYWTLDSAPCSLVFCLSLQSWWLYSDIMHDEMNLRVWCLIIIINQKKKPQQLIWLNVAYIIFHLITSGHPVTKWLRRTPYSYTALSLSVDTSVMSFCTFLLYLWVKSFNSLSLNVVNSFSSFYLPVCLWWSLSPQPGLAWHEAAAGEHEAAGAGHGPPFLSLPAQL